MQPPALPAGPWARVTLTRPLAGRIVPWGWCAPKHRLFQAPDASCAATDCDSGVAAPARKRRPMQGPGSSSQPEPPNVPETRPTTTPAAGTEGAGEDSTPTARTGRESGSSLRRLRGELLLPEPGDRIDTFVLEEAIGIGGMGAVFRARDTRLERLVALKILPPEQASDPEVVPRFYQEARAAAGLDHEN